MTKPYPDYGCLYQVYSYVAGHDGAKYTEVATMNWRGGMSLSHRIEQTVAALHELRDKGLIEGRNGSYSRYAHGGSGASEWFAVDAWPLLWCSAPKVPKVGEKKETGHWCRIDARCPWCDNKGFSLLVGEANQEGVARYRCLHCNASWHRDIVTEEDGSVVQGPPVLDGGVPWFMREKAKKFVPVDGEPEEDTGLVERAPTSVGKGQRRLDA